MKKTVIFFSVLSLFLLLQASVYAQDQKKEKLRLDDYYIDFAIPDIGAFTLLNTKPDNITTPGSVKEVAASIMSAVSSGYTITPGLAIDWSPGQTWIKACTPKAYSKNALIRNLQITTGTVADTSGTRVALGLKWTFLDKTDPLMDVAFRKYLEVLMSKGQSEVTKDKNKFIHDLSAYIHAICVSYSITNEPGLWAATSKLLNPTDSIQRKIAVNENFKKATATILSYINQTGTRELNEEENRQLSELCYRLYQIGTNIESFHSSLYQDLSDAKKEWLNNHWNATIMTFGLGWTGNSVNNKWSSLSIQTLKAYLNGQFKIKKKSMVTALISYTMQQPGATTDSTILSQVFGGARFLTGNARNRFSLDLGYGYKFAQSTSFNQQTLNAAIGFEFKISDGMFFEIASGLTGAPSEFFSSGSIMALGGLKYALHPNKRFQTGE